MIYTSYFANWRKFPQGMQIISIARFAPRNFQGRQYLKLAPSAQILNDYKNGVINEEQYTQLFLTYLNTLDKEAILNELGDNCILCCYEKSTTFCHRHIVANWLGIHEL